MLEVKTLNYYEFLQISVNADSDTIHRVYRFLAARYHPDNPETGDPEKFFLLTAAYDVLSDPVLRAEYDANGEQPTPELPPLSNSIDFMDQIDGEQNRRLALLTVLYQRRRTSPFAPEVSLAEIEIRMGFPRDYLDFTTWYLSKKEFITRADNSDFTLTALGVDFVETHRGTLPILKKLLTNGLESTAATKWEEKSQELSTESATPPTELDVELVQETPQTTFEPQMGEILEEQPTVEVAQPMMTEPLVGDTVEEPELVAVAAEPTAPQASQNGPQAPERRFNKKNRRKASRNWRPVSSQLAA